MERSRTAGSDYGDQEYVNLDDDEFFALFSPETERDAGSLMDPCNHSPIAYRENSDNHEFNTDTSIMEILYSTLLQCQCENKRRRDAVTTGCMEGRFADTQDELSRFADRVANCVRMQSSTQCFGVPKGFFMVSEELRTKLLPALKRAKRSDSLAWEYWTMQYAIDHAESNVDHESLILKHVIELAASASGLDLTQAQINVWLLLYFALMMVNQAHWGPLFVMSIVGHSGIGKSHVGDKVRQSIPESMSSPEDGQSEKAKFLSDDKRALCNATRHRSLGSSTKRYSNGIMFYKQYDMVKGAKRMRYGLTADQLKMIIADKAGVYYLCGNFKASIAIRQRAIEVDATEDDSRSKDARDSCDRVNGKHNSESQAAALFDAQDVDGVKYCATHD